MDTRTIRRIAVTLPGDEPEDLDSYETVPADGATVAGATISGDIWARATLTGVRVSRTWLVNADLSGTRIEVGAWDRVAARGCTLVGATLHGVSMRNVLFENCRLDYATLDKIRATGPVAFLGCSLTDTQLTGCQLPDAVFDGCRFANTQLDGTDLRGADLQGNDLAGLVGISSIEGATIGYEQLSALTSAVVRDFDLTIRDRP